MDTLKQLIDAHRAEIDDARSQKLRISSKRSQPELRVLEEVGISLKSLTSVKISQLKKPRCNQRIPIESSVKVLIDSFHQDGFVGGIVVEGNTMAVIDGWQRVIQWQKLGHDTVPCFLIARTPDQVSKLHLRLNTHASVFDPEGLGLEFTKSELIKDFGFTAADLEVPGPLNTPKFSEPQKDNETGFIKVPASISKEDYNRLKQIKIETQTGTISNALTFLINYYYEMHNKSN